MTLVREIPGAGTLFLDHLLLDLNGTLTTWGEIEEGLGAKLGSLAEQLEIHLLSADTYGTLEKTASSLGLTPEKVVSGAEKRTTAARLGADRCAAIGNGTNDAEMLGICALGVAIVGREGASAAAVAAADLLSPSIGDALDLLLSNSGVAAGLRP